MSEKWNTDLGNNILLPLEKYGEMCRDEKVSFL